MKIGFIGLGIMGKPMSKNLIKAGYELVVYNRSRSSVEELAALGAQAADSPADVASKCQVIITMLPNSPQVREVCLGENGILEMAGAGAVVIDMSSIDPIESKAIDGTLSVMAGGLYIRKCETRVFTAGREASVFTA